MSLQLYFTLAEGSVNSEILLMWPGQAHTSGIVKCSFHLLLLIELAIVLIERIFLPKWGNSGHTALWAVWPDGYMILFNIWPITTTKICQITYIIYKSKLKIMPNTIWTLSKWPKWWHFAKSGHTAPCDTLGSNPYQMFPWDLPRKTSRFFSARKRGEPEI